MTTDKPINNSARKGGPYGSPEGYYCPFGLRGWAAGGVDEEHPEFQEDESPPARDVWEENLPRKWETGQWVLDLLWKEVETWT
ncbi:Hypothetical predicted protein [Marmota monax]|uniref:Uncharacterized protein n=1 Tax=Marmota monax TaxID=9995 RepID=A0A5E4CXV9_MARMO|nr:hypothetical protein GHT09_015372 [Marmota monax]VTJ85782.1 Hypothetical predicted protein [Marmota monax]